jgi:hypothetical protein
LNTLAATISSILSGGAFAAIILLVFKESLVKVLEKRLEQFKHHLDLSAKTHELTLTTAFDERLEQIKHALDITAKTHELTLSSEIAFRERQLSEFYVPIYTILKRNETIHDHWCDDRLDGVEKSVRELFLSSNIQISEIILAKSYLIEGKKFPKSFIDFLTHTFVWKAFAESEFEQFPFDRYEFPNAFFKPDFPNEIFATTESLKETLFDLRSRGVIQAPQSPIPVS